MRSMPKALAAVVVLAAASGAVAAPKEAPEVKLARLLDGRVAGEPVNCINASNTDSIEIIDGVAIVYRMKNGVAYVNRPSIGADSLRRDQVLVTKMNGSQLCRMDMVTLVDQGSRFQSGAISLGTFTPYAKPRP
ncbi:hypothetical protein [Caulobacter segnis]|uniref:Uncharacterized protein n=2 Tax=Caulobacter segnis TaxID=88688 RepID=D5VEZ1_CAUST|nr:hypothetical protein [Caulobacter segnis]ADG09409.1 conserved hypothetical protein [Caulobacter segnis ATCC 21756]